MRLENTKQVARDALPFGIFGSILGVAVGAGVQFLDNYVSTGKQDAKMAGIGAVTLGSIFQVGGMLHVNRTLGGKGLLLSPILGATGGAGGIAWSKFKKNHSDAKTIMKYGLVGGTIGASLGLGGDYLITQLN